MMRRGESCALIPMEADGNHTPPHDPALTLLAPGSGLQIRHGTLVVDIELKPVDVSRRSLAMMCLAGRSCGASRDDRLGVLSHAAVGRIRHGRFCFEGQDYQLLRNLGGPAKHDVALAMPLWVDAYASSHVELSLALPADERWPFGGSAHQRIEVSEDRLRMTLMVRAGECAMPATIGWHPWFQKPDRVDIHLQQVYPRDA